MNYWYYSRPNEIFLDLDKPKAISRAFNVLSLAHQRRNLKIKNIYIYQSATKGHVHVIVALRDVMTIIDRAAWSLWMANDRLRVAYWLKREIDEVPCGDLLVGRQRYHREEDDVCDCTGKHKDDLVTKHCPAMARLLGSPELAAADYFTRTGRIGLRPVDPILFPWGRVDLKRLKQWGESDGQQKNLL